VAAGDLASDGRWDSVVLTALTTDGDPWIEGTWDTDSRRFVGDRAVFGAFDDLGAVRWADGSLGITAAVPEPASWALLLLGVMAIAAARRQRAPEA
jgi:hypothetical protein